MIEKEIIRIDLSKKGLLEKYVILKKGKLSPFFLFPYKCKNKKK